MPQSQLLQIQKGSLVTDELRNFLREYLDTPNAMSLNRLAKKIGVSHVSLGKFRDGGGIGYSNGIQLGVLIGFDLEKFLMKSA